MASCSTYKETFKYVAPGPCGNSIGQDAENKCNSSQTDTINGYPQRCTVVYQLNGIAWNGSCRQGTALVNDCYEAQAFCNINKGQRTMDIIPLEDLMILPNSDFKERIITDDIWNRIYEILLTIFNFPIPTKSNDTSRRGVRNPYIYELVQCNKGPKEALSLTYHVYKNGPDGNDLECYQIYIDGGSQTGWHRGMWRWSEVVPSYSTIKNKIDKSNGDLTLVVQTNLGKAEVPKFRNFNADTDKTKWDDLVKTQKVYIRHNVMVNNKNQIVGVKPGDVTMAQKFNEILGIMDLKTGTINSGVKITEALMQQIQRNILNYELDPSRCRSCNTYCNASPCETTTWQTDTEKCGEGGGCSAMYGCMCYFQYSGAGQGDCAQISCGYRLGIT